MAACVLALLVVAPTVGMAVCACADDTVVVAVGVEAGAEAVRADSQDHAPCDAACCVSGHCHHGGAMLDAAIVGVAAPAPAVSEPATAPARALASHTLSSLDRPPRA